MLPIKHAGDAKCGVDRRTSRTDSERHLLRVLASCVVGFLVLALVVVSILLIQGHLALAARVIGIAAILLGAIVGIVSLFHLASATFVTASDADDDAGAGEAADVTVLPTMPIDLSLPARLYIRGQGGRVYIWMADFSDEFVRLRAATVQPSAVGPFLRRRVKGVDAFISPDVRVPQLSVRFSLLRRPHLFAYWRGGFVAAG